MLFASASASGKDAKVPICSRPPITELKQAICWGKYHVTKVSPEFDLLKMKAEAKLQNEVWSVWLIPANVQMAGGGATLAIRKDNGELLELWWNQ